jgi:hypothetical protein
METHIAARGAKIQSHKCSGAFAAPQRARSQGKTRKKQQSKFKWCFLFLLRRGCPSLSQGKMVARALLQREGAFSAPQGAWDGTTQQSKRNNRRQGKKKKRPILPKPL